MNLAVDGAELVGKLIATMGQRGATLVATEYTADGITPFSLVFFNPELSEVGHVLLKTATKPYKMTTFDPPRKREQPQHNCFLSEYQPMLPDWAVYVKNDDVS